MPRKKTAQRPARSNSASPQKRKSVKKKSGSQRKYGPKAQEKVEEAMHEMKQGKLRSGRTGKKVTSRQQAIAIGLSEARREGGKAPPPR